MTALQCASTLVIARAGEAEYESTGWGDRRGSLTPRGRRQAAELAEALAGRRVAQVWTSTRARAVQTAEIVAAALGVGVTTREGLRVAGRRPGSAPDTPLTGARTDREAADRFGAVLGEVADAHPGETVLVVSHGEAIGLGVPALARLATTQVRLGPCQTVEVLADADGWVCTRWGGRP